MHAHTCPHPGGGCSRKVGERGEGSCPYLDLHLDLQVGPVDGEQCAVSAGRAQLPGAVGHVPGQSARRTSGEEEETWQEKVPSSVEDGTGDCISGEGHAW